MPPPGTPTERIYVVEDEFLNLWLNFLYPWRIQDFPEIGDIISKGEVVVRIFYCQIHQMSVVYEN